MTEKLTAAFKESGAQMDKLFGDMAANMPKAEVFDGLLETSKQQLGSTMQQITKMDAGNKLFGRNKYLNPVIFNGDEKNIGKITKVKIESCNKNSLFGQIENKNMKAA